MAGKRASQKAKFVGFLASGKSGLKCVALAMMLGCLPTIRRLIPMQYGAMKVFAARRGWTAAMQVKEVGSGLSKCWSSTFGWSTSMLPTAIRLAAKGSPRSWPAWTR